MLIKKNPVDVDPSSRTCAPLVYSKNGIVESIRTAADDSTVIVSSQLLFAVSMAQFTSQKVQVSLRQQSITPPGKRRVGPEGCTSTSTECQDQISSPLHVYGNAQSYDATGLPCSRFDTTTRLDPRLSVDFRCRYARHTPCHLYKKLFAL